MKTKHIKKFLQIAEDLENEYPFIYVEICRTRTTYWAAWLREEPGGELIALGKGSTVNEACKDALKAYGEWESEKAFNDANPGLAEAKSKLDGLSIRGEL